MTNSLYILIVFFLTVAQAMSDEQRIDVCKSSLTQIYTMLRVHPQDWRSYTSLARTIVSQLDSTTFMQQPSRMPEHTWVIAGLQRFAFADPDRGGLPDLVAWCTRQWLAIVHRDAQNVTALRGLGQLWLCRAQPALSRIHQSEGSPTSNDGSQASHDGSHRSRRPGSGNGSSASPTSSAEAEQKAGTADYVEARGYLQPATEYLERAVAAAAAQQASSGELLATAAEAYMSLGNASSPRNNERCFQRAIELLQLASAVPAYSLSRYLQRYLDEYGRLLD